jgi:hypothetical protein
VRCICGGDYVANLHGAIKQATGRGDGNVMWKECDSGRFDGGESVTAMGLGKL